MPRLFSYTIPIDDGSAPNPFRGMCSLAICKPGIRRVAKKGDWVAGLGSKKAPSGDLSERLVYAMLVQEVLPLKKYDDYAAERWPHRMPNTKSPDLTDRLGDCIYDFSKGSPVQRAGVHGPENMERDLSGENVLLSWDFYYFGNQAIELPPELRMIVHQTQGHRSNLNTPYFAKFESWVQSLKLTSGQHGWPDFIVNWNSASPHCLCAGCECDDPY